MDIKGKSDGASPIATPQNEAGDVSRSQSVPKGGSPGELGQYTTWSGNRANGNSASGKNGPAQPGKDGGHGFTLDERMTKWGAGNIDTGFERRELPDRSNVLTANSQASDMTRSKPKLLDQGTRAKASE